MTEVNKNNDLYIGAYWLYIGAYWVVSFTFEYLVKTCVETCVECVCAPLR